MSYSAVGIRTTSLDSSIPTGDLATGEPQSYRLRRGHPEVENGEPLDKYLSAYGDAKHFFFPLETAELLADTSALAVIVEAEKSALAIMAAANRTGRHVLVIGTGGCWGWRGTCRQDDGRRRRTRR